MIAKEEKAAQGGEGPARRRGRGTADDPSRKWSGIGIPAVAAAVLPPRSRPEPERPAEDREN
ncbi:hypothetical protein [Propylenella binzhouense]|uniref:Uncharacterized protein n=1 Tax=Propylenella binzhouense TaxID=2555902 RepID=A0A964T3N7_9HYPH|nr:hypothetical protein [Propylenella binzhouense]MYZ47906.1 hypothetical protein [Propylenella binzhouense]